uniref:Defensin coprisin n=1 Tax=Copris tripartitus TaxID=438892 RepID=DEF_COPTR|nr:RecName: Full=Defensin coprisin; Flags: Precursor [Copris tripartitus]ABP97087.1 coprisin [Copris tripartitus]
MAKLIAFALVASLCLSMVLCNPLPEEVQEEGLVRQKRVTCDVLSFEAKGIAVNHSACALHCIALRKKGGSCQNGVCVCRN